MTARIILIGGTSHAGKSTLAAAVADRLCRRCISTDSLARHPGRPWRDAPDKVPPHVVEHYRDLPLDALMRSVLSHYRAMWNPLILPLIEGGEPLVLEGSALLPECAVNLLSADVDAVWLVANDALIERRIRAESGYASATAEARLLIEKFAARAVAFNRFIAQEVERLGLSKLDVVEATHMQDLLKRLVSRNATGGD